MNGCTYLFLGLFAFSTACFAQVNTSSGASTNSVAAHVFKYTNPITRDTSISMRDHCIVKVENKWYCTGTSNPVWTGPNPGVRLLVSNDLIHWQQHSWIIDASKLSANCPYNGRFWAPEIHYIKSKYWLTVNSGKVTKEDPKGMKTHSIWLFVSDEVTGPYKLVNGPLTPQYNNDATLFEDEDGQTYLYCSGNGLFQAKIDLTSGKLIGNIQKFLDKKEPGYPEWMVGGIEGPFVIKKEGKKIATHDFLIPIMEGEISHIAVLDNKGQKIFPRLHYIVEEKAYTYNEGSANEGKETAIKTGDQKEIVLSGLLIWAKLTYK